MIDDSVAPCFARGAKFRFDSVREAWIVLAPERLFQPDTHATEVLRLVDGKRRFGDIVNDLCLRYDAPRGVVAGDVSAMLEDLAERGVLVL